MLPTQVTALSSSVTVRGRRLLVDGAPFTVRGVNYSPLESYAKRETSPPDIFYEAHRAVSWNISWNIS